MMPAGEVGRGDGEVEGQFRGDDMFIQGLQRMIDMGDVWVVVICVFGGVGGQKENRGSTKSTPHSYEKT